MVKLRLTKRLGKRCWYFSGRMERFRRTKCGNGAYFAIGDRADWSYLLPERLDRGRYVLDAIAIDGAGNRTPLERGTHAGGVHRPMRRAGRHRVSRAARRAAASAPARSPAARSP